MEIIASNISYTFMYVMQEIILSGFPSKATIGGYFSYFLVLALLQLHSDLLRQLTSCLLHQYQSTADSNHVCH